MMHRLASIWCICYANMMLLPLVAMLRCLPQCAVRHTSLGVAVIIGEANIICRRQTSFKKRTFVGRQKCVFCWWGKVDSDHRSQWQQIYSLPPLAAREIPQNRNHCCDSVGAGDRSRTNNLLITNQLLCHWATPAYYIIKFNILNKKLNYFLNGGGGRIRTIEAKRNRFTVCPLWPLGNSPMSYLIIFIVFRRTAELTMTSI